jgi:anaerobic magnesium-protoporphyrin IX monomethyl ester cyclase
MEIDNVKRERRDIMFMNPPLSNEERYGVKFKAGGQTPPTGLCLLAGVCREKGYATGIIDCPALNLGPEEAARRILKINPKYLGLTAVTISIYNAADVAKIVKEKNPNIKIILGGPHITTVPQETVDKLGKFFDIAVLGEGERTIIELIEHLEKGKKLDNVKGIAYFKDNKTKLTITKPREFIENLDELPFPAWDMLPNLAKYYTPPAHTVKRFPAALIVSSRGCPGMCTFCDNKVFGRRLRAYSADYVIRMIKHLQKRYGIKEFQFRDDNFLVFRARTIEICKKIIEQKLDIVWSCTGRVSGIDIEMLRMLKKAGCWQIWYGVESGSDKVLGTIKKNTTQKMIAETINNTKRVGISPCGFFMIGMPSETEEDIKRTIRTLLALPIDEFHMTHLTPFPGSEMYATASSYGYLDDDWRKMSCWKTVFVPNGLSEEKLVYYANLAMKKFYFRPRIVLNYIKKVRSWHHFRVYFDAFLSFVLYTKMKERK